MGTQGARGAVNKKPPVMSRAASPRGLCRFLCKPRSMPRGHHVIKSIPGGILVAVLARDANPALACRAVPGAIVLGVDIEHAGKSQVQVLRSSGCTSTISATQFHLRTSFRITSSANQPGGGRSRYSIAVMVRRGQARRAARGVLAVWAQGPVSGPETNREAGARPI